MELSTVLIIILIYLTCITVSLFIDEMKLRLAFYMLVALGTLCFLNIYLTITYYIKLRNDPGVPGKQGTKGPKGVKGDPGKCSYSTSCGIQDARGKILNTASTMFDIEKVCLNEPSLKTCKDKETLDMANPVYDQINMLEKIAKSTTLSEEDFNRKIKKALSDE
jgi:hypothetical protein